MSDMRGGGLAIHDTPPPHRTVYYYAVRRWAREGRRLPSVNKLGETE